MNKQLIRRSTIIFSLQLIGNGVAEGREKYFYSQRHEHLQKLEKIELNKKQNIERTQHFRNCIAFNFQFKKKEKTDFLMISLIFQNEKNNPL